MSLSDLVVRLLVAVTIMIVVAGLLLLGLDRLRTAWSSVRTRLRVTVPYLVALAATLGVETVARDHGPEVSGLIGLNVTGLIYALEGDFVAHLQSVATPWLTAYFSFVYLAGYVFLLVFPLVAYFVLSSPIEFKRTTVAYAVNYTVALVLYVLFISYGPRNLIPDGVEPLLYSTYPSAQLLTSEVNTNTNVFPSLHTSLSTTVAFMAYRTRDVYRGWFLLATALAASVVFSTMYLGIHWATDVLAGVALGLGGVYAADEFLSWRSLDDSDGWR